MVEPILHNDTVLSITLLALFSLLSLELFEFSYSRIFGLCESPPKLIHTKISTSLSLLQNQQQKQQQGIANTDSSDDPLLAIMDNDGYATRDLIDIMSKEFPNETHRTIIRFLIARKGLIDQALFMLKANIIWRKNNLGAIEDVRNALNSKALFSHSKSKSGTHIIYFRGALYDRSIASTSDYVKAAAHIIENQFINEVSLEKPSKVSVLIHTAYVDGAINAPADLGFIKEFVQVLSDNFPERLERLIIYPFPWFGRAIWSVAKTFIDQRTVDKVILLAQGPNGEYACPPKIAEFVDISQIPKLCGGKDITDICYP